MKGEKKNMEFVIKKATSQKTGKEYYQIYLEDKNGIKHYLKVDDYGKWCYALAVGSIKEISLKSN